MKRSDIITFVVIIVIAIIIFIIGYSFIPSESFTTAGHFIPDAIPFEEYIVPEFVRKRFSS